MEHFCAQFVFPGPAAAGSPCATEIANLTSLRELWQLFQRFLQNNLSTRRVVRRPEGPADGMVDKNRARRCDFAHDIERRADHQRRYASSFDHMGYETDGLMTEGSIGNQQGEVDFGLDQVLGDSRSELGFDLVMLPDAAHE